MGINWQRVGGYVILVSAAIGLIWVNQYRWAEDFSASSVTATAVPPIPTTTGPTSTQPPTTVPAEFNAPLPIIADNSLAPIPNPYTYETKLPAHDFQTHEVKRGETPGMIAETYGISSDTLLGGNAWLSKESNQLQVGIELIILPIDGVLHTVRPGETLASIAEFYNVPVADIIGYGPNNIEPPFLRLLPETQLLIPGASIGQFYFTAPKSVGTGAGNEPQWTVFGTGTYIWPVSGRCITQFSNGFHPALDISMAAGSPVYASDTGTVTYASYAAGVYYDYGNLIVINHGNGFETFYGHLSSISVYPGQTLTQGEFIGLTGNSGRSSGPHIHFEIRDNDRRTNPLDRLGSGYQDCT